MSATFYTRFSGVGYSGSVRFGVSRRTSSTPLPLGQMRPVAGSTPMCSLRHPPRPTFGGCTTWRPVLPMAGSTPRPPPRPPPRERAVRVRHGRRQAEQREEGRGQSPPLDAAPGGGRRPRSAPPRSLRPRRPGARRCPPPGHRVRRDPDGVAAAARERPLAGRPVPQRVPSLGTTPTPLAPAAARTGAETHAARPRARRTKARMPSRFGRQASRRFRLPWPHRRHLPASLADASAERSARWMLCRAGKAIAPRRRNSVSARDTVSEVNPR